MHSLPLFHRLAGQKVVVVGSGEAAQAKRQLLARAGAIIVDEAAGPGGGEARLAFIAGDDAAAAAARLRARGLLVNVVDRPDLCDFTVPSVLERGPVLVAVATGGASAGLAKALRLRLETLLPASLGALAEGLAAAREALRARWPAAADRRRALDQALGDGGVLDPLRETSAAALPAWLEAESAAPVAAAEFTVFSDDPDDLTLRQARLLGMADCIAFEPGVAPAMLARARADAIQLALPRGGELPAGEGLVVVIRRG